MVDSARQVHGACKCTLGGRIKPCRRELKNPPNFLRKELTITKLLITIGLVILASSLFLSVSKTNWNFQEPDKSKDRGKLSWYAARAKAKGLREVVIGAPVVTYAVPKDLEEALAYYTLVVAEPLEQRSYVEDGETTIKSWYKFRLLEELSSASIKCTTCPDIEPAPKDFLPLQTNEFLVSKAEGEVEVDGVRIKSNDRDFPAFEKSKRYLVFLSFDSQKTVAAVRMGPWGTFAIDASNEQLKPVSQKYKHPVIEQLTSGTDSSLKGLRRRLHGSKN